MDFLDKLHFAGWGAAGAIVAALVVAILRNRKSGNENRKGKNRGAKN